MNLQSSHRFYLLVDLGIMPAVVNLLLNGAIAWTAFQSLLYVPLWGVQSISSDILGTTFMLPFITFLFITPLARREVYRNRFPAIEFPRRLDQVIDIAPDSTILRAFIVGIFSLIIFGPISLLILSMLDISHLSFNHFVVFKAIFASGLGIIATPIIGLLSIGGSLTNRTLSNC